MFLFFDNREAEQNKEDYDKGALTERGAHSVAGEVVKFARDFALSLTWTKKKYREAIYRALA